MAENGVDYGMTPQGFIPKRLAQILNDMNDGIAEIVDPGSGEYPFQNATDDSLLQQTIGVFGQALSECWEAAYDGSVQFDPLKNSGAGQAGTVQLNAMLKMPGAYTILALRVTGKEGSAIPVGSRVATIDGLEVYATTADVILGASGAASVEAQCTLKGPFTPATGTVIAIQTPQPGWLGASNTSTLSVGSWEETEEELRVRQQQSTSLTSYRLIDSIFAAVRNVPGVKFARAYQNTSYNPEDYRGIPFKEVAVVVVDGEDQAIAEEIRLRLPTGQTGYGSTGVMFYDDQGLENPIYFSRPSKVPVYVSLTVKVTNASIFPSNGADMIKRNIILYADYGGDGNADGFPPGTAITRTRLYTPINSVPGHSIESLRIGTSAGNLKEQDITMGWRQVGNFSTARITVNVVGYAAT